MTMEKFPPDSARRFRVKGWLRFIASQPKEHWTSHLPETLAPEDETIPDSNEALSADERRQIVKNVFMANAARTK